MEQWDWQLTIATLCVGWAAVVLLRRAQRLWSARNAGSCEAAGCDACSAESAGIPEPRKRPFVSLDSLQADRRD